MDTSFQRAGGQLSADQLTKLAVMVAPVMPKHPSFWNVRKTQKLIAPLQWVVMKHITSEWKTLEKEGTLRKGNESLV